ncbi:P-loop containing nucleoside triphosphate hydrolase protein [Fomitopsis serialis]|uniref:P-loop containing nucleoside triphosphate hydrolase protein n=1 Tax=Fomitopsis serialis TaxID=139415 RepID=UPI002008AA0F|nr:P-loop containing nucleoside triphosphate hydrolase protein [Neoantrodia serialis]KAH9929167.1 P-loop containing nucleoside triphosphate hydrolase protein [Neoantrodia serialis]
MSDNDGSCDSDGSPSNALDNIDGRVSLRLPPIGMSLLYPHLPSSSALQRGTRLLLTGGIVEAYRRLLMFVARSVVDRVFVTATFAEEDPVYRQARDIEVTTRHYGLEANNSPHPWLPPREDQRDTSKAMSYLPRLDKTYHMWYKRRFMLVSRQVSPASPSGLSNKSEYLQIRILAFNHRILGELLEEARAEYKAAKENVISVWASNNMNHWINITANPKRALNTVILDPGVKERLLEDARDFLNSQPWYAARGIPFRRGYLLHGAPGSGKSSTIQSIAGELGLDVYIVSLSRTGLDDNSLYELIGGLPKRCIALMEDIDAAFKQGIARNLDVPKDKDGATPSTLRPQSPNEGRIVFATTNNFSALDPALRRAGRMDEHIEFTHASKYQAQELFKRFYAPAGGAKVPAGHWTSEKVLQNGSRSRSLSAVDDAEKNVAELAARFSEIIPDREFSMASLQGYLMRYKVRPQDAVHDAPEWVEQELGGKDRKRC